MPRPRHTLAAALAAGSLVAGPMLAKAGPTVIRDEMLEDTAITPSLGRGYSMATNTYQSTCLIDVVGTEPSYNFNYVFRELTDDETDTGKVQGVMSTPGVSADLPKGLDIGSLTLEWKKDRTSTRARTTKRKHILVTIYVDVYYRSVDEAKSKLSPAATKILQGKDVPGFFDACGMYYVRSISRRAAVISLLTYSYTKEDDSDTFVDHLKATLRGFKLPTAEKKTLTQKDAEVTTDTTTTTTVSSTVTDLQITTKAVGLGKSQSTELIAYDLETFQKTLQSAFQATQPLDVGRVTAIEVVPWIENTEFQSLVTLDPVIVPVVDGNGAPVIDTSDPQNPKPRMQTVLPYEQKRTLNVNAEFLAEVDRAARAKLNAYYKAKLCRSQINLDHMLMDRDGKWQFRPAPTRATPKATTGDLWLASNRQAGEEHWIQLAELDRKLSEDTLQRLWMEYDAFMYGGTAAALGDVQNDPVERSKLARAILLGTRTDVGYPRDVFPGAGRCVADLFAAGVSAVSYRTVPTCQRIEETFATVASQEIDDYCMPRFTGRAPTR
jgi:hypothetical protein